MSDGRSGRMTTLALVPPIMSGEYSTIGSSQTDGIMGDLLFPILLARK